MNSHSAMVRIQILSVVIPPSPSFQSFKFSGCRSSCIHEIKFNGLEKGPKRYVITHSEGALPLDVHRHSFTQALGQRLARRMFSDSKTVDFFMVTRPLSSTRISISRRFFNQLLTISFKHINSSLMLSFISPPSSLRLPARSRNSFTHTPWRPNACGLHSFMPGNIGIYRISWLSILIISLLLDLARANCCSRDFECGALLSLASTEKLLAKVDLAW